MDSVSCKRIPIWYELKLLFIAWLALPNFRGAAFIYDKFVREQLRKHGLTSAAASGKKDDGKSSSPSSKSKFLAFVTPKKVSSSAADSALATPAHHDFF
jgi:receptor expression-enhancing protein 5/6